MRSPARPRAGSLRVESAVLVALVALVGCAALTRLGEAFHGALAGEDGARAAAPSMVLSWQAGTGDVARVAADVAQLSEHITNVVGARAAGVAPRMLASLHPEVVRRANVWFAHPAPLASGDPGGSKRELAEALLAREWRTVDAYVGEVVAPRHAYAGHDIPALVRELNDVIARNRARHGDALEPAIASADIRRLNGPGLAFVRDLLLSREARIAAEAPRWHGSSGMHPEIERAMLERARRTVDEALAKDALSRRELNQVYVAVGSALTHGTVDQWETQLMRTTGRVALLVPSTGAAVLDPAVRWASRAEAMGVQELPLTFSATTMEKAFDHLGRAHEVLQEMFTDHRTAMGPARELHAAHRLAGRYLESVYATARRDDPALASAIARTVGRLGPEGKDEGFGTLVERLTTKKWLAKVSPESHADLALVAPLFEGDDNLRAIAKVALPGAPKAVRERLIAPWLGIDGPLPMEALRALADRPWLRDVEELHRRTRLGHPSVPLDEMPAVLARADALYEEAKLINPERPGAVRRRGIRALAEPTLQFIRRELAHRSQEIDEIEQMYAGATDGIDVVRQRIRQADREAARMLGRRRLSFQDLQTEVSRYMAAVSNNPYLDSVHLPPNITERWFPYLTDTDEFWGYEEVWNWRHARTLPAELPSMGKGPYDTPFDFMRHEFGHLRTVERNEDPAVIDWVTARFDALEKSEPDVARELALFLGNFRWETGMGRPFSYFLEQTAVEPVTEIRGLGELPDALPDGKIHFSPRATEVLSEWARAWVKGHPPAL